MDNNTFTQAGHTRRKKSIDRSREENGTSRYMANKKERNEQSIGCSFKLYMPEDQDLFEWIQTQPKKGEYFRSLIKKDMEAHNK